MKRITYNLILSFIFSFAVLLYIVFKIGDLQMLSPIISILAIISILLSIPKTSVPTRIFTLLFIITGTWMVALKGIDSYSYLLFYGDMLYLLSLLAMVPLLTIPIKLGKYDQSIQTILVEKSGSMSKLHRIISSISFLLGSILNLATIPIVYYSIKNTVNKFISTNTDKFLCLAIVHGFAVSIAWTPFSAAVAFTLETVEVAWGTIVLQLFFVSLCGLVLNWILFHLKMKRLGINQSASEIALSQEQVVNVSEGVERPYRKVLLLVVSIIILLTIVLLLEQFLSFGLVMTTTMISLPFAFIWSLVIKKGFLFIKETKTYIETSVPKMTDQFAIFLSTGFFVKALQFTEYNHFINAGILDVSGAVGGHVFLLLLPLIILGLGFIGMHPVTGIMLLAELLEPSILGISAEKMAIALIGGAVMTFSLGPFSGTMNMFSMIIQKNTFRIASWNILYTIVFFLFLVLVLLI